MPSLRQVQSASQRRYVSVPALGEPDIWLLPAIRAVAAELAGALGEWIYVRPWIVDDPDELGNRLTSLQLSQACRASADDPLGCRMLLAAAPVIFECVHPWFAQVVVRTFSENDPRVGGDACA